MHQEALIRHNNNTWTWYHYQIIECESEECSVDMRRAVAYEVGSMICQRDRIFAFLSLFLLLN